MSDIPLKILMGLGFLALSGLASYGVYSFFVPPTRTIGRILRADSTIIVLSSDKHASHNDEEWYEKVQILASGNADPKLTDYSKETAGTEEDKKAKNIGKIKDICKWLLSSDSRDYFKFVQAKYWCTVPVVKQED